MIVAILPDASKAETLLNNLSEADFDLNDVSVILHDPATRNKIAHDAGPLRGVLPDQLASALGKAGVSTAQARQCADAVVHGKAVIAMKVDPKYEASAREMFQDMSAEILES